MFNPLEILKLATGSERAAEALLKSATGAATFVSATASVRTDMRTKKMDGKLDTIIKDTDAIKTKVGSISVETSDIKNGQMAAVNKFFDMSKKTEKVEKKEKKEKKKNKEKKNKDKPVENATTEGNTESK